MAKRSKRGCSKNKLGSLTTCRYEEKMRVSRLSWIMNPIIAMRSKDTNTGVLLFLQLTLKGSFTQNKRRPQDRTNFSLLLPRSPGSLSPRDIMRIKNGEKLYRTTFQA